MTVYRKNAHSRKPSRLPKSQPDLFTWANARGCLPAFIPPSPPAVRHVAKRFGLPPHLARVHAQHAGFNLEANNV